MDPIPGIPSPFSKMNFPKNPDPSKNGFILRTPKHPCEIQVQTHPSIGGSNRGFLRSENDWPLPRMASAAQDGRTSKASAAVPQKSSGRWHQNLHNLHLQVGW